MLALSGPSKVFPVSCPPPPEVTHTTVNAARITRRILSFVLFDNVSIDVPSCPFKKILFCGRYKFPEPFPPS
jgi:hypothetical protein